MTLLSTESRAIERSSPFPDVAVVKVTATIPTPVVEKVSSTKPQQPSLLRKFVDSHRELESYKNGNPVVINGQDLSVAAVAATSRYNASVALDASPEVKARILKSRSVIASKVQSETSVYGVSTGFGGSADTRTDNPILLGHALLQHQHAGILPSDPTVPLSVLPLLDPLNSSSMPEAWVRGAILIRMNSLIRGHSGVRWELIEKMNELLSANVTPLVPLRGSISASGDLSPLSYIAGTLVGNPSIRVFDGPAKFGARDILPSSKALAAHGIAPLPLASKEHLGILNGTAFSASVASLAINEAIHHALFAQVLTAMGTEALIGTRASFDHFIHEIARPHPGQVESAKIIWDLLEGSTFAVTKEEEVHIGQDSGVLRQDRYPLRTAPQFLGPQIEDLLHSLQSLTIECNSTTDNPLIDGETGTIHHGGNFQAMAVTNAMEKTRLSLHHIGKLLFAQSTELLNPSMNRGLPPSLAATNPSLNYHAKGLDIATAAYVGELGYLANPVSSHIQSAEMHNQAVNSLALISARATMESLQVLSILMSTYLYVICQALDLRTLQKELTDGLDNIVAEELALSFGSFVPSADLAALTPKVKAAIHTALDETTKMDLNERMKTVAASSDSVLLDSIANLALLNFTDVSAAGAALLALPQFKSHVASRGATLLEDLQRAYLTGARGPAPASRFLNKTRPVYEFVRLTLGIKMHGIENFNEFEHGLGVDEVTLGQNISLIHEAIRDGKMQSIVAGLFA
ncbi:phenylalanine ammonia-lyase [Pluteus cervinus]|uniref:Phenylalanine ammonia-lyase n=1 Tax=Pluteus cervinus TaxID=181527 RepID=A0ACD3B836_9AGAR|nr:phenylalanine ammonia-lyase [Pluteus cervinus]